MNRPTTTTAVALFLGLGALTACDTGSEPLDLGLAPPESHAVASALTGMAFSSTDDAASGPQATGPARAPVPFGASLTVEVPCPMGGSVAVDGSLEGAHDPDASSLELDLEATQVHSDCGVDADGLTVWVTGNPSLTLTSHVELSGDPPAGQQTLTLEGAFDWRAEDGREGTCSISLSGARDFVAGTGSLTGSVCDVSMEVTVG